MGRKIAFVFCESDIAKTADQHYELFPLNSELKLTLSKKKRNYKILEDYFKKSEANFINSKASKWAYEWRKGEDKLFKNLDLSMHNYFSKILFLLSCLDNLLDKKSVDLVFLGNENCKKNSFLVSNFEEISPLIKLVCASKKIKLLSERRVNNKFIKQLVQFVLVPKLKRIDIKRLPGKSVIFASHHYHINSCINLLRKLNDSKIFIPVVVGKIGGAKYELKKEKINFIDYHDEIEFENYPKYLFFKIKLLLDLRKYLSTKKSFNFKSYELTEIFLFKIASLFIYDGPRLKSAFEIFRKLVRLIQPKSVIVATNDSLIQTFISAAKKESVPTIEIQHGITSGLDCAYMKADISVVWGKISKYIYNKSGVPKQKIVVCGWPAFEKYKKSAKSVRRGSNLLRILFLAHDPQGMSLPFLTWSSEKSFKIFFESMRKIKDVEISVRLHPRADENHLFATAKRFGVNFRLSKDELLVEELRKCDVVIGQTTSASIDALMMGKPLIYLPSMKFPFPFLENSGTVFETNSSRGLIHNLRQIRSVRTNKQVVKNSKKFLNSYCNFNHNSIELIYKTIKINAIS